MKFRTRFSVRTLAIVVTLVCAYFGAWEATKEWGVPPPRGTWASNSFMKAIVYSNSPGPFIVRKYVVQGTERVEYYFWFFWPEFKLPFESAWSFDRYSSSGEMERV